MKKSTVVIFVAFAIVFALAIPFWVISGEGEADSNPAAVADADEEGEEIFVANCGPCHTLDAAGTHGVVGPNLDDLLGVGTPEANYDRVLAAIEGGVEGRMPADILSGEQADQVADFVSRYAGQ